MKPTELNNNALVPKEELYSCGGIYLGKSSFKERKLKLNQFKVGKNAIVVKHDRTYLYTHTY